MKVIPTPILPSYPCDDCGHTACARMPLIGGRECVCSGCYPVRSWSPISDADHRAALKKSADKVPKRYEREVSA